MSRAVYVVLLMFGAVCVYAADDLMNQVKTVVANSNLYLKQNGLDQLSLPDFIETSSLYELKLRNSKAGNFSSTEVQEVEFVNMTDLGGPKLYTFDVVLGLNPAEISYDFHLVVEGLFPMMGTVKVAAYTNSYAASGTVLVQPDGSCNAVLQKCKFREMKNFKVDIQPRSVSYFSAAKKFLLDAVAPHYLPRVNKVLADLVQKQSFQDVFSNIVCRNMKK